VRNALGGDRVRAQRADPCAAQQARGRQPASTRPAAAARRQGERPKNTSEKHNIPRKKSMDYKVLIVEDDYMNAALLQSMIEELKAPLKILGRCSTVDDAIQKIQQTEPHLVFMDIHLADGSGLDVLDQTRDEDYEVVFTTAYNQYAIQAFEVEALHYLLKPLEVEELEKAVKRFLDKREQLRALSKEQVSQKLERTQWVRIPISSQNEVKYLEAKYLRYIQADGSYTHLYGPANEGPILASKSIGYFERLLEETTFFRIHDKYMVNLQCVEKYIRGKGGEVVLQTGEVLPVSVRRKTDFLAYFEKFMGHEK
jgi:two-component system LytT family response regulator